MWLWMALMPMLVMFAFVDATIVAFAYALGACDVADDDACVL
jgi:hypothetical protein